MCWSGDTEVHRVCGWLLRQLDTSAKLKRKACRMFDFPLPEASTSAQPTAIISLKTHMITVNICWFQVIASITYAWRSHSHVFLKGQHFLLLVNFIWMVPLVHGQVEWIMPGMNPISLTTKVDLGQKWPLLGLWDGVLDPSSHSSEEAILPSGCRPLEIYLLEFLSGLFNHQEKTEWKKPTCRRS